MDLQRLKTIIIVMMENRSFDHVLGYLSRSAGRTDVNGIKDDAWIALQENPGRHGSYCPYPLKRMEIPDPPHERDPIAMQIGPAPGSTQGMRGFVQSYARRQPPPDDESLVMGFYGAGDVTMADFFAREFLISDQWFASIPTGTQPNRLMAMSGMTTLEDNARLLLPNQELVYDWLDRQRISWRVYYDGPVPFFSLMLRWQPAIAEGLALDTLGVHTRFRRYTHFDRDFRYDPTLPSVIFVEPEYTDGPHWNPDDDHPPTSIAAGQAFLYSVYQTLMRRPDRWAETLMIVTYDEHGGFFDHVSPPPLTTNPPPGCSYQPFKTTGVRVPAFIVSPFVKRRDVFSGRLEHTGILSLLAERFTPGQPYSALVAARSAELPSARLTDALSLDDPRRDLPPPPPGALVMPPTLPATTPRLRGRAPSTDATRRAFQEALRTMIANHPIAALELAPDAAHFGSSEAP